MRMNSIYVSISISYPLSSQERWLVAPILEVPRIESLLSGKRKKEFAPIFNLVPKF